jgi:hypothetical protein
MDVPVQFPERSGSSLTSEDLEKIKGLVNDAARTSPAKPKDRWDKAGVIAQVLSGVIIAAFAIYLTHVTQEATIAQTAEQLKITTQQAIDQSDLVKQQNLAQRDLSKQESDAQLKLTSGHDQAELDLEGKKNVTAFLSLLRDETKPERRAELLGDMEAALTSGAAVKVAIDYAHPPFDFFEWPPRNAEDPAYSGAKIVSDRAMEVLDHLKDDKEGEKELRQISQSAVMPDREVAKGILGSRSNVWLRVSMVDDLGELFVYNVDPFLITANTPRTRLYHEMTLFEDSRWISVSPYLRTGDNTLFFYVSNNGGPCSGRLQLSAGAQQYDTGPYYRRDCPVSQSAFSVTVHLRLRSDGTVLILDRNPGQAQVQGILAR